MDTQLRIYLNIYLEQVAMRLGLKDKDILEIGIAGDEKPSGSYKFFGKGNNWRIGRKKGGRVEGGKMEKAGDSEHE